MATHRLSIIDWDDTLFPTTWTNNLHLNLKIPSSETVNMFSALDQLIINLIVKLQEDSQVRIISNGSQSWINICLKVLPQTRQLISLGVFDIMSARDICADMYDHGREWKEWTFKLCVTETMSEIKSNTCQHIISIGDSKDEEYALKKLEDYGGGVHRILKSVKLKKNPDLNDVVNQLIRLENLIFDIIFNHEDQVYDLS